MHEVVQGCCGVIATRQKLETRNFVIFEKFYKFSTRPEGDTYDPHANVQQVTRAEQIHKMLEAREDVDRYVTQQIFLYHALHLRS